MSRKLSSLLYTSGEDLDWNEMVGEDKEEEGDSEELVTRDSGERGLVLRFRGASCLG